VTSDNESSRRKYAADRRLGNVEAEPLFVDSDMLLPIGGARSSHASSDSPRPINVSMVVLLAEPQKYDDKFIRTIGFVCLEYEGDALYLHEQDYRHQNYENALELRGTKAVRELKPETGDC
jgi:hypothetical protein